MLGLQQRYQLFPYTTLFRSQVVTFVGTLMIGVLAVALIVSQTPWFKDWLRRYIVRESKQYLNGELTIGGLGGNLLDRKSTRLNSSHTVISYAVFCLKKKTRP